MEYIWKQRQDWFFGVDMGVYHTTGTNPKVAVVPDGFLSLGVERHKGGKSRTSYVVWEENEIQPILTLEVVSQTPGNKYSAFIFEIYEFRSPLNKIVRLCPKKTRPLRLFYLY